MTRADETKVGHGFVDAPAGSHFANVGRCAFKTGEQFFPLCGQPRSAHPGEETPMPGAACTTCGDRGGSTGSHYCRTAAPAGIAEEPGETIGGKTQADIVEIVMDIKHEFAYGSHTKYEKARAEFDAWLSEVFALLRVRSEGGGEKAETFDYLAVSATLTRVIREHLPNCLRYLASRDCDHMTGIVVYWAKKIAREPAPSGEKGWQPIETADEAKRSHQPVILALIRNGRVWRVLDGKHNGLAWYTLNGEATFAPTHWMPLPEPPKEETR